ncbi:MAG: CIA30 family protein [Candidatus Brocadiia bacterium]
MEQQAVRQTLIEFEGPDAVRGWQIVNDTVMGGVSESRLEPTDSGTAVFTGSVSLENYGGFASVRSPAGRRDLSDFEGLVVRVRGDGKTYKLGVRTDARFDGVVWQASFGTQADAWQQVRVPFGEFVPTYRGRVLEGRGPLDRSAVMSFSFQISDKQEGPFALEIAWLGAY